MSYFLFIYFSQVIFISLADGLLCYYKITAILYINTQPMGLISKACVHSDLIVECAYA